MASSHTPNKLTMTVADHLGELRLQLFFVALTFVFFSIASYIYRNEVIGWLLAPLNGQSLSYLTPGGGFGFIFAVMMWCGVAGALPFLVFVAYRFVSPALPQSIQGRSVSVLIVSTILFILGATFGYFVAIPSAIQFLLGFANTYVQAMLTADSYLNFVVVYTVGLGVLFQIPLVMAITNWVRPLPLRKLFFAQKYVILCAFIAAAILTPTPDIVNQCILAVPIIAMYEIGVLHIAYTRWRSKSVRAIDKGKA